MESQSGVLAGAGSVGGVGRLGPMVGYGADSIAGVLEEVWQWKLSGGVVWSGSEE